MTEINDVKLFVLARNHMHFTGQQLDERSAWGSWYQILAGYLALTHERLANYGIKELYNSLKFGTPEHKLKKDGKRSVMKFQIKFTDFSLEHIS